MSEATLILTNMRGGCATVDGTVHTLFRFNGRLPRANGAHVAQRAIDASKQQPSEQAEARA